MKKKSQTLFDLAKNIGPALIIVGFLMLISIITTNIIYQPKDVVMRVYEIKLSADGKPIIKVEKPVDFAELMKLADIDRGKKVFKKCASCHNVKKDSGHKVGPNLYGIINRKKGSFIDFSYSKAMKSFGGKWDRKSIDAFIKKPNEYMPGTKMSFAGLKKHQQRADVIKYLENLD